MGHTGAALGDAGFLRFLIRWTGHIAIGAEDAAIPRLRFQECAFARCARSLPSSAEMKRPDTARASGHSAPLDAACYFVACSRCVRASSACPVAALASFFLPSAIDASRCLMPSLV